MHLKFIGLLCFVIQTIYVLYSLLLITDDKVSCDNIGGVCFTGHTPVPIDVVYTWVNGSDENFQESIDYHMKRFRDHDVAIDKPNNTIAEKLNIFTGRSILNSENKKAAPSADNGETPFDTPKECPIESCIASPAVVSIEPIGDEEITLEQIKSFIGFSKVLEVKYAQPENTDGVLMFLKFPSVTDATFASGKIITIGTLTLKFKPIFYSPEHGEGPYVRTSSKLVDISSCRISNYHNISGLLSYDEVQSHVCIEKNSLLDLQKECPGVSPKETFLVWPSWDKYAIGHLSGSEVGSHRFADNEELKYSIRSLFMFAPWVRNIYILTNGQIPNWLDVDHDRIKIVTHEEVFRNRSHLPTFSSPAIEANIHNIPGLSEHFLYFNDDVFLGQPVVPGDFIAPEGYKIFLAWNIPNCNTGCPANWLTDGYCDAACNVSACNFDGGDCTLGAPSVANVVNNLLNAQGGASVYAFNYCNPGCSPSWIGDKYCDPACNVQHCGFDAGDCGIKDIKSKIFDVSLRNVANRSIVELPLGIDAMYFNVTFLNGSTVVSAKYDTGNTSAVRTSVLSVPHKIISLTFLPNKTESVSMMFNFDDDKCMTITLKTNSYPSLEPFVKPLPEEKLTLNGNPKEPWIFPEIKTIDTAPFDSIVTKYNADVDMTDLSQTAIIENENLLRQIEAGILTDKGRWIKLAQFIEKEKSESLPSRKLQSEIYPQRHLLDTFADSLHHVNNLYSSKFGKAQRKVLSHMPFLVNRTILSDLHSQFPLQFNKTSSNQFRSSDDMQFAFSYYYFMIHATHKPSMSGFLHDVDIDKDGKFSSGELVVLMSRIFNLPISPANRTNFDSLIMNCSDIVEGILTPINILHCPEMVKLVNQSLVNVTTYPHVVTDDKDVTFKMLKSNTTKVRIDLDIVRRKPKKFICLNDNMDHGSYKHAENFRLLQEFYQTMFPHPSPVEHPPGKLNSFTYKYQYVLLKNSHNDLIRLIKLFGICLVIYWCCWKKNLMRKLLKGCLFRLFSN